MGVVKIFGLIDLFAAGVILLDLAGLGTWRVTVSAAGILIVKGLAFRKDLVSLFDIAIGIYILFLLVGNIYVISWIAAIHLSIKGVSSMF